MLQAATELAWRGTENTFCLNVYCKKETKKPHETRRIIYNPKFSKSTLRGSKSLCQDKWLAPENLLDCLKIISKRSKNIKTNRQFLIQMEINNGKFLFGMKIALLA